MKIFIGDPYNIMGQEELEKLQQEKNSDLFFLREIQDNKHMLYHFEIAKDSNMKIDLLPETSYLPTYAISGKYISIIKHYCKTENDIHTKPGIILDTGLNGEVVIQTEEQNNKLMIVLKVFSVKSDAVLAASFIEIDLEGGEQDGKNS